MGAENVAPRGFDLRTVQPVASRYTDWVILAKNAVNTKAIVQRFKSEQFRRFRRELDELNGCSKTSIYQKYESDFPVLCHGPNTTQNLLSLAAETVTAMCKLLQVIQASNLVLT